jgi:hypothetical protein
VPCPYLCCHSEALKRPKNLLFFFFSFKSNSRFFVAARRLCSVPLLRMTGVFGLSRFPNPVFFCLLPLLPASCLLFFLLPLPLSTANCHPTPPRTPGGETPPLQFYYIAIALAILYCFLPPASCRLCLYCHCSCHCNSIFLPPASCRLCLYCHCSCHCNSIFLPPATFAFIAIALAIALAIAIL